MQMVRLVLPALLVCSAVLAQQRPARGSRPAAPKPAVADLNQPFPLREIAVRGNASFAAAQVIELSGLSQGQVVSKKDFDAAQQKLLATGLFETVAYRFEAIPGAQAYRATLEVKEIAQLFPYRFEAIEADAKEMRAFLRSREPLFTDQIPATEPVLKKMAALVEEFLRAKDKPVQVVGRLMPDASNRMEVVFQPSSLPAVAEVQFHGSKALTNPMLQQAIAGTAIGALYTENRFRQILEATIRPLFEAEGRLRVTFPKLETAPAADVKGVIVTVHVNDGPIYKLRSIALGGAMSEDEGLLKAGRFREGEVANMTAVQEGAKNMERVLKRRGFLKAESKIERKIDDQAKAVDVVIHVDPGQQYRMGMLIIKGLDVETEPHIRKLWALKPNQPFDVEYPDLFLSKMPEYLDSLGKTKSVVEPDPGTLKVDVTLFFEGEKKRPEKPRIP